MITDFPNTKKVLAGIEQSGWNLQEPHKWSYYFYDENRQALNRLFEELSDDKFQLESLNKQDWSRRSTETKEKNGTPSKNR